jgi:hypothetical protein
MAVDTLAVEMSRTVTGDDVNLTGNCFSIGRRFTSDWLALQISHVNGCFSTFSHAWCTLLNSLPARFPSWHETTFRRISHGRWPKFEESNVPHLGFSPRPPLAPYGFPTSPARSYVSLSRYIVKTYVLELAKLLQALDKLPTLFHSKHVVDGDLALR